MDLSRACSHAHHTLFGSMFTSVVTAVALICSSVGAVDVRAQARPRPEDPATLLEQQSGWVQRRESEELPPASLLRSEKTRVVVSDEGQVSADPQITSIEELLKEELAKQVKEGKDEQSKPKVVACAGTDKGAVPLGFEYPENYPSDPAWTVKDIWAGNKAGLYGPEVLDAKYVAVTLAEQQPNGGYYYVVFGDSLEDLQGTKLDLPMSDCEFGDVEKKFLRMGARPDSEPRANGNMTTTWNGTTWRVYENSAHRNAPKKKDRTVFPSIQFPSLDGNETEPPAHGDDQLAFTRDMQETSLPPKSDPFLIKIKGLSAPTTTTKATLHNDVQEIKEALHGLVEEIQALKVGGGVAVTNADIPLDSDRDEDIVDIKDLYLAGRLLPKKGHFQIDSDGSSSIHEDGVNLRLDPGTSPSPMGGDNDLFVNLYGYSCSKFFGSLRITKARPEGAKGITFFTYQAEKSIGSVLVGGKVPQDFSFQYRLDPKVSNMSLRVHDHGTPDKDFFEIEGYLSCKVDCTARALDTDTGSCESLSDDQVRCEGAADPHGRPCQWNGASCLTIASGRCSRETLCHDVWDGSSDCNIRTDYDSCSQRTDGNAALCGWKDKEQKCFTSTFNCKASHGKHNQRTTTPFSTYQEYVTEGKTSAYDMVS